MAQESISIPKYRQFSSSMDYESMRQEGINRTQMLSGDIWTDYNEHDPGITILENLCYSLTELGYKTNLPIEDLLFGKSGEAFDPRENAMFPAPEVLPCTPQTILDYRKLIIDRVLGVKNAWLVPLDKSALGMNLNGLYHVYLQLDSTFRGEPAEVLRHTQRLLSAHRNLGEDIDRIEILQSEKIAFQAEINLSSHVVAESVLAEIFFQIGEMLTPQIRFHTLDELMEEGASWEEIYNCPLPKHGFILDQDLQRSELELLGSIHKSKLIKVLTEIEGVRSVGKFQLLLNGKPVRNEITQLPPNRFPELDMRILLPNRPAGEQYPIQFVLGELGYSLDLQTVRQTYDRLVTKYQQQYERPLDLTVIPPQPTRRLEDIEHYDTVQNHFPEVYGIGDRGLPSRVSRSRKAYAKQMQGYLVIFEQLMANYLSQLVNIRSLFSTNPSISQTYFSQDLFHVPGAMELLGQNQARHKEALEELVREFDRVFPRRNRMLDHLLARFGEEFLTDSFNTLNQRAASTASQEFDQSIIEAKVSFLQNYVSISRDRGKGYDYLAEGGDDQNVSGLKKRIALLFNFQDFKDRPLSQIAANERIQQNKKGGKKGELGLTFTFSSKNEDLLAEVLANGIERNHFRIDTDNASIIFVHPDTKEETVVCKASSIEQCETGLDALIAYLRQLNAESEGFHLLEHILLRPQQSVQIRFAYVQKDQRWLESDEFTAVEDRDDIRKQWAEQLKKLGASPENYQIVSDPEAKDSFRIELRNKDKSLLAWQGGLLLEESAKSHIQTLAKSLKKTSLKEILKEVQVEEESKKGGLFTDDPYSSRISLIFPAWTARFQNPKLRKLMERIVRLHTPAHLAVEVFWIGLEEMVRLEKTLADWRQLKRDSTPQLAQLDEHAFQLMLMVKSFEDPEDSWVQSQLASFSS